MGLAGAVAVFGYLRTRLRHAEAQRVDRARAYRREEYRGRRAGATFWQAVENVREDVRHSVYLSVELWRRYGSYRDALHARMHNFPAVPFAPADVPPLGEAFRKLERLVRQAEGDPEFAAILGQERGTEGATFEYYARTYEGQYEALINAERRRPGG